MPAPERLVLLLTDAQATGHAQPGHPERPERVPAAAAGVIDGARAAGAALRELNGLDPDLAPDRDDALAGVHDAAYLDDLAAMSAAGGGWLDPDTYVCPASWQAARAAAGQTIAAARAAVRGEAQVTFAAIRPPGHHAAAAQGRGFCLVNNVVAAARALRADGAAQRIAILDWDVHHGDGTQDLVASDPDILYASTHQFPWYPGTGGEDENSARVWNVPLPAGSGDPAFVAAWRRTLLPAVEGFAPDALLVSAGYDAHHADPLAGLAVTEAGFEAVATAVGGLARRLGLAGVALALEGGYDLPALQASAAATVRGLLAGMGSPLE